MPQRVPLLIEESVIEFRSTPPTYNFSVEPLMYVLMTTGTETVVLTVSRSVRVPVTTFARID